MWLADLHVHSTFSDGQLTIPDLVDFYGVRRFGCIAITDHICEEKSFLGLAAGCLGLTLTPATFPLYLEIIRSEAARAWERYRMLVLPGFELSRNSLSNRRSAHVLAINATEWVSADADVEDQTKLIRAQGALAIAAHPVSTRKFEAQTFHLWDRRRELAGAFDAWEVASGDVFFDEVAKSGLPLLATSDLHRPSQINAWKTAFDCERRPEAVLQAIQKQDVKFHRFVDDAREASPHERLRLDAPGEFCLGPMDAAWGRRFGGRGAGDRLLAGRDGAGGRPV